MLQRMLWTSLPASPEQAFALMAKEGFLRAVLVELGVTIAKLTFEIVHDEPESVVVTASVKRATDAGPLSVKAICCVGTYPAEGGGERGDPFSPAGACGEVEASVSLPGARDDVRLSILLEPLEGGCTFSVEGEFKQTSEQEPLIRRGILIVLEAMTGSLVTILSSSPGGA